MSKEKKILEEIVEIMEMEGKARKAPVYNVGKIVRKSIFRAIVFVLLSSRTKDNISIAAAKRLFRKAGSFEKLAKIPEEEVAALIYPVGFYRQKAKWLITNSKRVVNEGMPEDFLELDGIGRKSRNVILGMLGKEEIGVDTHVHRISNRLGLVKTKKPAETEKGLKKIFPRRFWRRLNRAFVGYGQTVCKPKPLCNQCKIKWCPARKTYIKRKSE
ncbi:MAG: endonuclease III [Candidatus Anstonellales archaeon]